MSTGGQTGVAIPADRTRPLFLAGTVLGIGMGGFVDGILFHQILQLHNMLSNWVIRDSLVNEQINMVWDGFFHAFTWVCVAVGLILLWRAVTQTGVLLSGKALWGALLFGWGLFNLVEGTIDHEILGVHHFYQNGNHLLWDMVFLFAGLIFLVTGWALAKGGFRESARTAGSA